MHEIKIIATEVSICSLINRANQVIMRYHEAISQNLIKKKRRHSNIAKIQIAQIQSMRQAIHVYQTQKKKPYRNYPIAKTWTNFKIQEALPRADLQVLKRMRKEDHSFQLWQAPQYYIYIKKITQLNSQNLEMDIIKAFRKSWCSIIKS